MQDMFGYHVEYKEFSPLIARRSLKIFLEQFDPDRSLPALQAKRSPIWSPKRKNQVRHQKYYQDDLSEYEKINHTIQEAIVRARGYREEIKEELIAGGEEPQMGAEGPIVDYPAAKKS